MIAYVRLAIVALVFVAGFGLGNRLKQGEWDAARAHQAEVDAAATLASARDALATTERRFKESQNAQDATAKELRALRTARDAARVERDGVSDVAREFERRLAEASDAEPACRTDEAARVALDVSRACAGEFEAMAGEAGELAGQLRGLQRWVAGVCAEPVRPPSEESRPDR